jgi:hypothetical protein
LATSIKQIVTVKNCFCAVLLSNILTNAYFHKEKLSSTTVGLSDHRSDQHTQVTKTKIDNWMKKWIIEANQSKSACITFTPRNQTCPTNEIGSISLLPKNEVKCAKCLDMYLNGRLTLAKHIETRRKHLKLKAKQVHGLLGRRSTLSIESKLLLYKQC